MEVSCLLSLKVTYALTFYASPVFQYYYPTCINIALTYKIPDILQDKPEGMNISEIGEKTGIHPRKVARILRMLASRHIFKEGKHIYSYEHNNQTMIYAILLF